MYLTEQHFEFDGSLACMRSHRKQRGNSFALFGLTASDLEDKSSGNQMRGAHGTTAYQNRTLVAAEEEEGEKEAEEEQSPLHDSKSRGSLSSLHKP